MRLVVDASVALKWVVDETDTDQALACLQHDILTVDLMFVECANALWKAAQRGLLAAPDVMTRMALLTNVPVEALPGRKHVTRGLEIALELGHPAYDTLYLAAAEAHDAQVVTADIRLLRRVMKTSLSPRVISLADAATN